MMILNHGIHQTLHKLITSLTQNILFLEKQGEKGELEKKIKQFDPKVVTQPGCGA